MARINLLPWREERRLKQKKEYTVQFVISIAAAGLVVFGGLQYLNQSIDYQTSRNQRLEQEIKILDQRIKEINELKEKKRQLENRMRVIQNLQLQRPGIVHLFDEMVKTLPDGVFITSVGQKGNQIAIDGKADSNARVSSYMTRLERSDWLGTAKLDIITADEIQGVKIQNFKLVVPQETTP